MVKYSLRTVPKLIVTHFSAVTCGFFLTLLFISCNNHQVKLIPQQSISILVQKNNTINENELQTWYFKDIFNDTLPGISLSKALEYLKDESKKDTIIVAVIDMAVDINHEDLKGSIWTNKNEISNNSIDDDGNGYIDDINGWNFLGRKDGTSNEFTNYEYTRILRKFKEYYQGDKDSSQLNNEDRELFLSALLKHKERSEFAKSDLEMNLGAFDYMSELDSVAKSIFDNKEYDLTSLNSALNQYKGNIEMVSFLEDLVTITEHGVTFYDVKEELLQSEERFNKLLNLDYDDRKYIEDNPNDINDRNYGNNIIDYNVKRMNHGTAVAGVIAANRSNSIGAMGISNEILIMPLVVSGFGDEHDKDMALAIRYAADNGAKIINISSIKYFSLHENWVHDAIKYAEEKDVLVVHGAGNDKNNVDEEGFYFSPNDVSSEGNEISDNFINVASSGYELNKNLKAKHSAFGHKHVDLFAPGVDIYTLDSKTGGYKTDSGTSYAAAIVSGIAGILRSYYPNLTAQEVKYILMTSGIHYNVMVEVKSMSKSDITEKTPFSKLSKSGRIVNAYNALVLAEKMSTSK